jgi:hypothetical protein
LKRRVKILTATSFSRYKAHATCPRSAKYKFIDKYPEPPAGPALARGGQIHKGIQGYIEGARRALPQDESTDYGPLAKVMLRLRRAKASCELELAVNADWELCDWMAPDVWFRSKLDAALLTRKTLALELFDHKTGAQRPDEHTEQLEQYIAIAPAMWPEALSAEASMLYVDHGRDAVSVHPDLPAAAAQLRKKWTKRFSRMLNDRTWRATPGDHCRWCPFSKKKGGPCDAG